METAPLVHPGRGRDDGAESPLVALNVSGSGSKMTGSSRVVRQAFTQSHTSSIASTPLQWEHKHGQ